jgi:signal transduction histidine kinase
LANPAAQKLFGNGDRTLEGVSVHQLFAKKELLKLYNGNQSSTVEYLADGSNYVASLSPVATADGTAANALILRDISTFRKAEGLRADFLSTLSHDLHDPLELLRGYVSMVGMVGELNDQQQSYVQKIDHSIENISRLSTSLLDLDRLHSGQGLRRSAFMPADLLAEAVAEVTPRARQKKIDIVIEEPRGTPQLLEADRTLLQRALYNLLDNAVKFSTRGETVEVSTTYKAGTVTIGVHDHGAGIARVDLPNLFNQASNQTSFGLSIVKSIVERHAGRVWAESELGMGSTFYCELPLERSKE